MKLTYLRNNRFKASSQEVKEKGILTDREYWQEELVGSSAKVMPRQEKNKF